jgi:imidazolonepropionase-like amidohydrolase
MYSKTITTAIITLGFLATACDSPETSVTASGPVAIAKEPAGELKPADKTALRKLPTKPAAVTAFVGATVFDATGNNPIEDAVIVLSKDRIVAVGPKTEVSVPDDAVVIDVAGKWIVPGLVDSHIHFFQSAGIYARPHVVDLRETRPYEEEMKALKEDLSDTLRRYLVTGQTAVVDMGGPFWNFKVREEANAMLLAPRTAVAGPLVSTIAREKLDIGDPPIIKAETPEEARDLVQKQLEQKPDLAKVWFIVSKERSPERGLEQTVGIMRAATDEAHKGGVRVAVHATELASAKEALRAGADILVHSVHDEKIDDEFISLMKENNAILTPTLTVMEGYAEVLGNKPVLCEMDAKYGDPQVVKTWRELSSVSLEPPEEAAKRQAKNDARMPVMNENLMKLVEAKITIAAGTDAGNIGTLHGSALHHELKMMVKAGMPVKAVLIAATRDAAKVFAAEPEFGTLEKGKLADLLVLDADPLADISNLERISKIVKGGIVLDPNQILPPNPEWVVQKQVDAYNARDLDLFLSYYSEDTVLVRHPSGEVVAKGTEKMREVYGGLFKRAPKLNCRILSRITTGNMVIDHELVTGIEGRPYLHAVAIYEVNDGFITNVWFLPKDGD